VTRVKICGNTTLEDATLAADLGAWALGMIFHPPSPRRCREEDAVEITAALRRRVELCGVFVNPTLDGVAEMADRVGLTMLQLHGDEGPAFCAEAARRTGCKVIKAAQVASLADLQALETFHTDFHLLDAHSPGLRGGTGETFDWQLVRARHTSIPLVLSGGLRPDNVADAIAEIRPFAVDTASGTEATPGVKDPAKIAAFVEAVNATASEPERAETTAR
jgi:phosphoribosylanthranilate isomerase